MDKQLQLSFNEKQFKVAQDQSQNQRFSRNNEIKSIQTEANSTIQSGVVHLTIQPNKQKKSKSKPPATPVSVPPSDTISNYSKKTIDASRLKQIEEKMNQRGFTIKEVNDENLEFEYESDSVEKYTMISNEFDYETIKKTQNFLVKQYKDSVYKGQVDEYKKRHGFGVCVYENGRVYEGQWEQDVRSGSGYELFSNLNSYQGKYSNGKPHEKGIYTWQNGEVYDGEWCNGVKQGYGVWKGSDGIESYIGQWVNSRAQGFGVHVWSNGDKYEGEWHENLRHGNGTDFFSNGDIYVGQYHFGKPEGFGQYKWENGSNYTGQFLNGQKHGHGKWKRKPFTDDRGTRNNSYEGQYLLDKKHGQGTFEWESGNIYSGAYFEDERHGYGQMKWTDGSIYMGMWVKGIQQGLGIMIFADSTKRAGFFEQNVFKDILKSEKEINRQILPEECIREMENYLAKRGRLGQEEEQVEEVIEQPKQAIQEPVKQTPKRTFTKRQSKVTTDGESEKQKITRGLKPAESEDRNQSMQPRKQMVNQDTKKQEQIKQNQMPPKTPKQQPTVKQTSISSQAPLAPVQTKKKAAEIAIQTDLKMLEFNKFEMPNTEIVRNSYNQNVVVKKKPVDEKTQTSFLSTRLGNLVKNELPYYNERKSQLNQVDSFANELPNKQFLDTKINENILNSGPPTIDSDSDFNRNNSSMMMNTKNSMVASVLKPILQNSDVQRKKYQRPNFSQIPAQYTDTKIIRLQSSDSDVKTQPEVQKSIAENVRDQMNLTVDNKTFVPQSLQISQKNSTARQRFTPQKMYEESALKYHDFELVGLPQSGINWDDDQKESSQDSEQQTYINFDILQHNQNVKPAKMYEITEQQNEQDQLYLTTPSSSRQVNYRPVVKQMDQIKIKKRQSKISSGKPYLKKLNPYAQILQKPKLYESKRVYQKQYESDHSEEFKRRQSPNLPKNIISNQSLIEDGRKKVWVPGYVVRSLNNMRLGMKR